MKLFIWCFILATTVLFTGTIQAAPEPEPIADPKPVKDLYSKSRSVHTDDVAELRELDADEEDADGDDGDVEKDNNNSNNNNNNQTPDKADASSGRLFMKKFVLFKNMFGGQQQQPVIPIIITGGNNGGTGPGTYTTPPTTPPTPPTTTITSTGTIPTATGTITTEPIVGGRLRSEYNNNDNDEDAGAEENVAMDEQALQSALIAGAEEYVVTDEEIKGTSAGKVSRQPMRVNLKRKGAKKGQVISVRVPPKYRNYFKNGQRVMLNTKNNRPVKRRVLKRVNKNKNRKRKVNKNRRNRIVAA